MNRKGKKIAALPTLMTTGNLLCGVASICFAMNVWTPGERPADMGRFYEYLTFSGWLILLALVFDALDGSLARATKSASDFGLEMDSLADVVTFGVAPALLARQVLTGYREMLFADNALLLFVIVAVFPVCTALRLARFNIESDLNEESHKCFTGLPSPGAAGALVSLIVLHLWLAQNQYLRQQELAIIPRCMPFIILTLACLMISPLRYVHISNKVFNSEKTFPFVAILLLAMIPAILLKEIVIAAVFTFYVVSGVVGLALDRIVDRLEFDSYPD